MLDAEARNPALIRPVAENWWAVGLRGVLAIIFGIAAVAWPLAALAGLILVFGAWALADGVLALVEAVIHWRESRRWALLAEGALGIIFGAVVLVSPWIAILAWVYVIAAWALVTGVLEVVTGIRLRDQIEGEFWMILSGVVSIIFGLLITFWPLESALALTWLIGVYALVYGVFLLVLAFRLKRIHEKLGPTTTQQSAA